MSTESQPKKCDVLLLIATDVELDTLLQMAQERTSHKSNLELHENRAYFYLGTLGGAEVMAVRSEMGSGTIGGALATTLVAIRDLRPSAIIMPGIAFGVDPAKQSIGKVLVSQQIQTYESQRVGDSIELRGERATASPRLLNLFRTAVRTWRHTSDAAEFGLLLSGEKLIDNLEYRNNLLEFAPRAIGGEMEGAGMYAAAREEETPWIVVKAICDWADGNKSVKKTNRQKLAAERSIDLVLHTLSQAGTPSSLRPLPRSRCMARRPELFVPTERYKEAKKLLLDQDLSCNANKLVALCGAGGFGKTITANAISFDKAIRQRYRSGVLWLQLGKSFSHNDRLIRLKDIISYWTNKTSPGFESATIAAAYLRDLLIGARLVLIVDDVWKQADFEVIELLSSAVVVLITTRQRKQLPIYCSTVEIGPTTSTEALRILGLGVEPSSADPIKPLVELTARWPLLMRLANSQLRHWVTCGLGIEESVERVCSSLSEHGLEAFDNKSSDRREDAIQLTLNASLDGLGPNEKRRYIDLGVFPEGEDLEVQVMAAMWGLELRDAESFCGQLFEMSLISHLDLSAGIVRVHDIILRILKESMLGDIEPAHCRILERLMPKSGWHDLKPTHKYLWRNLAFHHHSGKRAEQFRALLFDLKFLQSKVRYLGLPSLVEDCATYEDNQVRKLKDTFRLSSHALRDYPEQLPSQLIARLSASDGGDIQRLLRECLRHSILIPLRAPLATTQGKLHRAFSSYKASTTSAAVLGDGTIVAAHSDAAISIMNPQTGKIAGQLHGHQDRINKLEPIKGRIFASASNDGTIRVWNVLKADSIKLFSGHSDKVLDVSTVDSRRIISASFDKTVRAWDLETSESETIATGASEFTRVMAIDNDLFITCSLDGFIRVWSASSRKCLSERLGHSRPAFALWPIGEDRVATTSQDNRIVIWNNRTLDVVDSYELNREYGIGVTAMVTLQNRYVAYSTWGGNISIWDPESSEDFHKQRALTGWGEFLLESIDGMLVSFSSENIVYFWNIEKLINGDIAEPTRHEMNVSGFAFAGERHFASSSWDSSLFAWNSEPARFLRAFGCHQGRVNDLIRLGDDHILSAGADGLIKLWDSKHFIHLKTINMSQPVVALTMLAHNSIVFLSGIPCVLGNWDISSGNIRIFQDSVPLFGEITRLSEVEVAVLSFYDGIVIFNTESWSETGALVGPVGHLAAITRIDDKHIAVVDSENAIVVLDRNTGELRRRLVGHKDTVASMGVLAGKYLASVAADRNIFIWDWPQGSMIASFTLDSKASALSISPSGDELLVGTEEGDVFIFAVKHLDGSPRKAFALEASSAAAQSSWRFVRRVGSSRPAKDYFGNSLNNRFENLLRQVVAGNWGEIEEIEAVDLKTQLDARDRVVLVDALLLVCLSKWQNSAFDLIFELSGDSSSIVVAEAGMALGTLLGLIAAGDLLHNSPSLLERVVDRLKEPDFVGKVLWARQARFSRSKRVAGDTPWPPWVPSPEELPHALWLRPVDIEDDFSSADLMAAPFKFLQQVSDSVGYSPALKRLIGASVSELPGESRARLFRSTNELALTTAKFNEEFSFFSARWEALEFFVRAKMSGAVRKNVIQKLYREERSFADLITLAPHRKLLLAREAARDAKAKLKSGDSEVGHGLAKIACGHYADVAGSFELDYQEWLFWAATLHGEANDSVSAPAIEEELRLGAIDKYERAAAIQPTDYAALYGVAVNLARVADLKAGVDGSVELRKKAIARFEEALLVATDKLLVLRYLSLQLLRSSSSEEIDLSTRQRYLLRADEVLRLISELDGIDLRQSYNYACLLALRGEVDDALISLESCLKAETISTAHVREDDDWKALRCDHRFEELLRNYESGPPRRESPPQ